MSQRILFSDKEEEYHKDEYEAIVSQGEEEVALELSKTELTDKIFHTFIFSYASLKVLHLFIKTIKT